MIRTPSANFTRPANTTAYASGDLVANSTTAGSVAPMEFGVSGAGVIRRARLHKSGSTATAATFVLHLWAASPTPTNGDNGAFAVDIAKDYLGSVTLDLSSGAFDATDGLIQLAAPSADIRFRFSGSTLYGLLEATAAYTPASEEVFTAHLEVDDA